MHRYSQEQGQQGGPEAPAPWNLQEPMSQVDNIILEFLSNNQELVDRLSGWVYDWQAKLVPQAEMEDTLATAIMEDLVNGASQVGQPYYDLVISSLYSINWDSVASSFFRLITSLGNPETEYSTKPASPAKEPPPVPEQPGAYTVPYKPQKNYTTTT